MSKKNQNIKNIENKDLKNGDFAKYYDSNMKRNYWVLGYFGGGSINVCNAMRLANEMSNTLNVPIGSIQIDEVLHSSRYKQFKYMYSMEENQPQESGSIAYENVFEMLTR